MEFSEFNTLMCPSRFTIVFVLQKNMEAIKVEPDSDDETHQSSPQNEYCVTDEKDAYPVHAEFLVMKAEHEVSSILHHYLFGYYPVLSRAFCMQLQLVGGVLYMDIRFSGDDLLSLSFIKVIMNYDGAG